MAKFAILIKTKKQYKEVVKKLKKRNYTCNFYKDSFNDAWLNYRSKTVLLCDDDGYVTYCSKDYYFKGEEDEKTEDTFNLRMLSDYPPIVEYGSRLLVVEDIK